MKTFLTISAVIILMLIIGGSCAVVLKPTECFEAIEKLQRVWQDLQSDAWVERSTKEAAKNAVQ